MGFFVRTDIDGIPEHTTSSGNAIVDSGSTSDVGFYINTDSFGNPVELDAAGNPIVHNDSSSWTAGAVAGYFCAWIGLIVLTIHFTANNVDSSLLTIPTLLILFPFAVAVVVRYLFRVKFNVLSPVLQLISAIGANKFVSVLASSFYHLKGEAKLEVTIAIFTSTAMFAAFLILFSIVLLDEANLACYYFIVYALYVYILPYIDYCYKAYYPNLHLTDWFLGIVVIVAIVFTFLYIFGLRKNSKA